MGTVAIGFGARFILCLRSEERQCNLVLGLLQPRRPIPDVAKLHLDPRLDADHHGEVQEDSDGP